MPLEAVRLKNDTNSESIRVKIVVCPKDDRKSEAIFENQSNWEPVGCIVEHTNDETKRKTMFENRSKWEPVGDIMERANGDPKSETKFENNDWAPVGDIMERAIEEAKLQTLFDNQRNWEPTRDVLEPANDENKREMFEDQRNWPVGEVEHANHKTRENPNWEPVDEVKCAKDEVNRDRIFENDRNWEPERDIEHANHATRGSKFENPNWERVDDDVERPNDEASKETKMFENDHNWEPVGDLVEHDNNQVKRETMFQVLPKQCIKENPNWEETKTIGDIYLNQHQIKGDFVLSPELLQSPNLYFTLQGQPQQSTLNEYQTEVGERRFIEINKGTPGKVVQIPISILQDPGFNGQMPFEIPVPPLIPLTNKRNSSLSKQAQSKPNEGQSQAERTGKLPESILPDLNADNSIELPPLVPIRKKYKPNVETDKIQSCTDKCCDKIHTETSVFKKPTTSKDGDSKSELNLQTPQKKHRSRPKKFPCSKCDFIADHSYQLKIHISLTHDANNQFKCNYCDYKSKYKKALYQHQKTHTEFRCNLCDYTCRQKSNLKIHQRTHKVARETLVPEAPRTRVHGAFRFCSGNSTSVRSQSHAAGRAPHTFTSNQ